MRNNKLFAEKVESGKLISQFHELSINILWTLIILVVPESVFLSPLHSSIVLKYTEHNLHHFNHL